MTILYLKFSGHCKLGRCKVECVVKSDEDDEGKDHSIVSDDATDLKMDGFTMY